MASDLLLVLDDSESENFRYIGEWDVNNMSQWYGGTSHSPNIGNRLSNQLGSFTVVFEGISIAFYGTTPSSSASQNMSVSIDGKPSLNTTYGDLAPATYRQWYESPDLPNGLHNITVSSIDGASLDFAVVSPALNTSLKAHTIIVDDDNLAIKYSGGWRRSLNGIESAGIPGSPFRNGTHQTWSAGDSLSFSFTGTSVSVYGIFSWENLGILSTTYTLDRISQSKSHSVTVDSPEFIGKVGQAPNFLYYTSGSITSGEHTLTINVTQTMNQSFILDYLTYRPSFTLPSQIPNHTAIISTTISSTSPVGVTRTSATAATSSVNKQNTDETFPVGPIIGGLLGGIFLFAFGCLLVYHVRRRRFESRYRNFETDSSNDSSRPLLQDSKQRDTQLRPASASSHRSVSPFPFSSVPTTPATPYSAQGLKLSRFPQRTRDVRIRRSEASSQSMTPNTRSLDTETIDSQPVSNDEDLSDVIHGARVLSSSTTLYSHPRATLEDRQPAWECSPTIHGGDMNRSGTERIVHAHEAPVRDDFRNQRGGLAAREQSPRTLLETDSLSGHQMPRIPPRLTPLRRGFTESPSANDIYSTSEYIGDPRRPIPIELGRETLGQGRLTPDTKPWAYPAQSSDRLTPVRRRFPDPPMTAPVVATRRSPIASAFPRLSAALLRHYSRRGSLGVSEGVEGDGSWNGQTPAPPAYDSLSPRRDGSPAPWTRRAESQPLPASV